MGLFRMLRLLIMAGVGYLLYRQLFAKSKGVRQADSTRGQQADDVLVEDPCCHIYIPRQGAESCTIAGTTHYFCSPECRKQFQSEPRSTT